MHALMHGKTLLESPSTQKYYRERILKPFKSGTPSVRGSKRKSKEPIKCRSFTPYG
jgi:hypothetical protein